MSFFSRKLCLILAVCSLPFWGQEGLAKDDVFSSPSSSMLLSKSAGERVLYAALGDINNDGKTNSQDRAVMSWLLARRTSESARKLNIKSFTASPSKIAAGASAELRWDVEGLPETLVIDNGVGDVKGKSSIRVTPSQTTTYTLRVSNSQEPEISAQVTVEIVPKIESFTADSSVIRDEDDTSTLRWRVSGRHSCIQINNGVGDVTEQTSVQVTRAGTYVLKVFYAGSEQNPCSGSFVSRRVVIHGVPRISFFRARPSAISSGATSVLSWSIQGETSRVSINQGVGVVDGNSVEVSPDQTTTYTLTAVNSYGRSQETVRVEVLALPVIESFTASRSLIGSSIEDTVVLRWEVSASGSFQLAMKEIDSDGNQKDSRFCRNLAQTRTSCYVFPSTTTSYVLTAKNSLGTAESESVRVAVLKINNPDPSAIVEGDSSQLSWEGSESAETLELQKKETGSRSYSFLANVRGSDSYEVSPTKTTSYRLKARHSNRNIYSRGVSVSVGGIASFTAHPPFVVKFDNPGVSTDTAEDEGETRLRWRLSNINSPQVQVFQTVNGNKTDITRSCRSSGCTVTPADTATTYTLQLSNSDGLDIEKQITVDILKIDRFKGSEGSSESTHQNCSLTSSEQRAVRTDHVVLECLNAASNQSVDLSWSGFDGYDSLTLKTCRLDSSSDRSCTETTQTVTNDGDKTISVTPSGHSSIYTLIAQKQTEDYSKDVELNIKVLVQDEVQVQAFSADDRIIKDGAGDQTTNLNWNITGKDPVNFELYKLPEGGSSTEVFSRDSPEDSKQSHYAYSFAGSDDKKTTEFTLTADNSFGSSDSEELKVYYLKIGSFTAEADSVNSSAENCSGADQCLTVTSGTPVTLNWSNVEGFGDENTSSSCGRSGRPECITDTLEITYNRGDHKISITDSRAVGGDETLTGSSNSNRIKRAPTATTIYTLTAKKQVGSETESLSKTIKVTVQDTPAISSFTARESTSNTSSLHRILKGSETTYLHYTHTGKDPYNLKLEQKLQGESSFTTGGRGFNTCASDGSSNCKSRRHIMPTPTKTTEYKLTLEKNNKKQDERTLKVYKLGLERFKARVRRSGSNIDSCTSASGDNQCSFACSGADECLTVTRNESITLSWSGVTGFEDERAGDLIQISKNQSDACSSSSYEDNSNPSASGSTSFSASGTAGTCIYTLTVQKTLGSGDDAETDKVTKTIKVSVNNPVSIDYFESRTSTSRANNTNINRIIQNSGSTTLLWKVFSASSNDTWKLKKQEEGASSTADFESISPSCTDTTDSPSSTVCNYRVSPINKTTTFTFEVTLSGGQKITSSPLKVYVLKVDDFEGTRGRDGSGSDSCTIPGGAGECISIESGESVRLSWMIEGFGGEGTDTLEISPNVQTGHGLSSCTGNPCKKNVKGQTTLSVSPTATTIYTLKAKKVIGSEEKEHSQKVRVTLGTRPRVGSFRAVKNSSTLTICRNSCSNFNITGNVSNADKVTIVSEQVNASGNKVNRCVGGGTYPNCTNIPLTNGAFTLSNQSISQTTKYTLNAENAVGSIKKIINDLDTPPGKIRVFKVKSFTATPACITSGGSSSLSWEIVEGINGANSVSINQSVGSQPSTCTLDNYGIETICTGSTSVNPTSNTIYTLTAKKPTGVSTDISYGTTRTVSVMASCPSSSRAGKSFSVSSVLFQDCENCPKMNGLSSLNRLSSVNTSSTNTSSDNMSSLSENASEPADTPPENTSSENTSDLADISPEGASSENTLGSADTPPENTSPVMPQNTSILSENADGFAYPSEDKVTYKQYQDCMSEGVCDSFDVSTLFSSAQTEIHLLENIEKLPIAPLSLTSALQYVKWLSEKTGKPYGVLADPSWIDNRTQYFTRENSNVSEADNANKNLKLEEVLRNFGMILEGHTERLNATPLDMDQGTLYFIHPQDTDVMEIYHNALDRLQTEEMNSYNSQSSTKDPIIFNSGFYVITSE